MHILLVEDNDHDVLAFRRTVERAFAPCDVVQCTRAEEALERVRAGSAPCDVVVVDHGLPGMSGLDLCERMLAGRNQPPIVMLTGSGSERLAVEALRAGVDDYVIKDERGRYLKLLPAVLLEVIQRRGNREARREAEAAVREAHESLTRRVAERTAELASANAHLHEAMAALHESHATLQRQEEETRAIVETAGDAIITTDSAGAVLTWNPAAERLFGWSASDAIGRTVASLIVPEALREAHARGISREGGAGAFRLFGGPVEMTACRRDGSMVPVELNLNEVRLDTGRHIVAVVRDVSQRKRAEAERLRLATAIEQAAEIVMITDREGTIEYVNPAFETITGYTREEAIGHNTNFLRSGKHAPAFYRELWETISRGEVWSGRMTNRCKDGRLYVEESVISPVQDETGQITGYVTVKRDVTRLVELEGGLRQAQKMEALGTLAGGVAHDFNNILAAILGNAELAVDGMAESDPTYHHLQGILAASERAIALVRQILVFGRRGDAERVAIELTPVIEEGIRLLRAALPTTVDIHVDLEPDAGTVIVDPTELYQVLLNLSVNAAHAMNQRGTLTIALTRADPTADAVAPGERACEDGYVCLSVRDEGCGMDAATRRRIFEPYFTTKAVGQGTGLGLSVVHGLVQSLGGTIAVESAPGCGSTFHVYFPAAHTCAAAPQAAPAPVRGGEESVLIVDDDPHILKFEAEALTRLGYTVRACDDAVDALEVLRARPAQFALVVTDQTMPGMTGIELASRAADLGGAPRFVLCTGANDADLLDAARSAGICEVLPKPFTPATLGAAVRRGLDDSTPTKAPAGMAPPEEQVPG